MFLTQRAQRFTEVARGGAGLCGALCSKRRRGAENFTTEGTEAHGCAARKRLWKTAFHALQPQPARSKYVCATRDHEIGGAANRAGAIACDTSPLRMKAFVWQGNGETVANIALGLRESRLVARNLRFSPRPPNTKTAFAEHENSLKRRNGRTCYNLANAAGLPAERSSGKVACDKLGWREYETGGAANRAGAIACDSSPLRLKAFVWQGNGETVANIALGLRESRLVARNLRFSPRPPNTKTAFAEHENSLKRRNGRTCYNLANAVGLSAERSSGQVACDKLGWREYETSGAANRAGAIAGDTSPLHPRIFRVSSCAAKAAFVSRASDADRRSSRRGDAGRRSLRLEYPREANGTAMRPSSHGGTATAQAATPRVRCAARSWSRVRAITNWHTNAGQMSAEEPKVSFALPSVSREGGFQRFPWCSTNYHLTTSYLKGKKAA